METDVWTAREGVGRLTDDMAGYMVQARDGTLGQVDRVSYSGNCLFVSAGRFIKHRYLIPAGAIERVDGDNKSLFVAVTKEQVEKAPAYEMHRGLDEECERQTTAYYSDLLALQTAPE